MKLFVVFLLFIKIDFLNYYFSKLLSRLKKRLDNRIQTDRIYIYSKFSIKTPVKICKKK